MRPNFVVPILILAGLVVIGGGGSAQGESAAVEGSKWLTERPWEWPKKEHLRRFGASDLTEVVRLYRSEAVLTNRLGATVALAWIGGDAAVDVLTNTLGAEFAGTTLTPPQWRLMETTFQAVGFLAAASDRARDFLVAALEAVPSGHPVGNWRLEPWTETERRQSVASAIWDALGMANRPELERRREGLRVGREMAPSRWVASGVVVGAFKSELVARVGRGEAFDLWTRPHVISERYAVWTRSDSGRRWQAWYAGIPSETR